MGLGLETINSVIRFVGSGGGSAPIAQTGDLLAFAILLLSLICIAAFCGIFAIKKAKAQPAQVGNHGRLEQGATKQSSIMQKLAIVVAVAALALSAGLLISKAPQLKAFGTNDEGVITVVVDENNGSIVSVGEGNLVENNTNGDFYIAKSFLRANDVAKDVAGVNDVSFNITADDVPVFEGTPNDNLNPYEPDKNFLIPYQGNALTKYIIETISPETAKALIGKDAYTLTLCPANVTIIQYDGNGATAGKAPDTQRIEWGDSVKSPKFNLATNTGGLAKPPFSFDG